ncbi:class I SAM-dependent methyltransferase [Corynebacterium sp. sy039]|uniref:class I SAM-dependent methyltransferase n=1 Tax=Corynebacterium sp. sy039 TaxID=2599641 RepID=UPI0011B675FC|nr:class I SAM-dependent methyltransferase [Corynebacterium sp. sy039]QDZ42546.1 class I SAM-dependent methyltransferase [Corynebacterium sp. sy039]
MLDRTISSYSQRATEYIEVLGSIEGMDPLDIALIKDWGCNVEGAILDAGAGPGHWSGLLEKCGCDVYGMDMVPEFVTTAAQHFPDVEFVYGNILNVPFRDSLFDGVLAWYSLIHMESDTCAYALKELARILKPGGTILVGAFLGDHDQAFDHAITQAFYFSEDRLSELLTVAGFCICSVQKRHPDNARPHISIVAERI